MRDAFKSMLRFGMSLSLFGARQALRLAEGPEAVAGAFEDVAEAARSASRSGSGMPRHEALPLPAPPLPAAPAAPLPPPTAPAPVASPAQPPQELPEPAWADSGRLDTSRLVILGEGIAAGMGDFGLSEEPQRASFPALLARQMRARLSQPLLQAPGLSWLPGFQTLPVRLPGVLQTTVLTDFPPAAPPGNLAIPGWTLADALDRGPMLPLIHRGDVRQTAANLILGLPALLRGGEGPWPSQLAVAVAQRPTFAVAALGYAEALTAAVQGDPAALPAPDVWRAQWRRLLAELRGAGAEVLVCTVPDPLDTAHFVPLESAARTLRVDPAALLSTYGLDPGGRVTLTGMLAIAVQLAAGVSTPLPAGAALSAATTAALGVRLGELNDALRAAAEENGAPVCDLHALFRGVRASGVLAGRRVLTADFLGGFYTLNGYYPGRTGQAMIANEALRVLTEVYGGSYVPVDLAFAAAADPAAGQRLPASEALRPIPGPGSAPASLPAAINAPAPRSGPPAPPAEAGPLVPAAEGPPRRLQLPPGLEQVLPLSRRSYHGDAIRIVDCKDARDAQWGSCGGLFFGGHVMYDSHLAGAVRIRFSPPEGDLARFQISHEGGLQGDDGMLAAPWLFRWPVRQARVEDAPGAVSAGTLNLATGEVTDLHYSVRYLNSALFALTRVNPHFPDQPIAFPGQYGSADARFEQRPDGLLDFTFYGSTFLPLGHELGGEPVRWALPFAGGDQQFASIPASGMVMHPHLFLTTRETVPEGESACPDLPFNTVLELPLFTRNSSFGDKFTLHTPELGGEAKGRSHVEGRLEIQIGERFGDAAPVLVNCLPPGGLLLPAPDSPLAAEFPGRLSPGPMGHDEFLRFPLRKYFLDSVSFIDDPFDVSVGAVDLRTGRFLADLLHRGLIGQNLFYALERAEPRTPKSSFFFRGPAVLERGAGGRPLFRLNAVVRVPYPAGFFFPAPDLATRFPIGEGSVLDPFLWLQAMEPSDVDPGFVQEDKAENVLASTGDRFSYRFAIPAAPSHRPALFEYTNHAQDATFHLDALSWVVFTHSRGSRSAAPDTVTFTGFGNWSRDPGHGVHTVVVQAAATAEHPYVSIQVDGGLVSNVNTKPQDERIALP